MPWRLATLRGTRVFARCDAAGGLVADGGRVEIRYKPQDTRSYRAAAGNLVPAGDEILPDSHCAAAEPAASGADTAKGKAGKRAPKATAQDAVAPETDHLPVVAYTDGACSGNPGPAGLGVAMRVGKRRTELSEYLGVGTNNIAELTAILRALEALEPSGEPVVVHTDSQYAIGVLTKGWKAKANQALIADLKRELTRVGQVRFVYVKGHAGIPLNERADELARLAVSERDNQGWQEVAFDAHTG